MYPAQTQAQAQSSGLPDAHELYQRVMAHPLSRGLISLPSRDSVANGNDRTTQRSAAERLQRLFAELLDPKSNDLCDRTPDACDALWLGDDLVPNWFPDWDPEKGGRVSDERRRELFLDRLRDFVRSRDVSEDGTVPAPVLLEALIGLLKDVREW